MNNKQFLLLARSPLYFLLFLYSRMRSSQGEIVLQLMRDDIPNLLLGNSSRVPIEVPNTFEGTSLPLFSSWSSLAFFFIEKACSFGILHDFNTQCEHVCRDHDSSVLVPSSISRCRPWVLEVAKQLPIMSHSSPQASLQGRNYSNEHPSKRIAGYN